MAIQKEIITGRLHEPDGDPITSGKVRFTLSRYDATDNGVIAASRKKEAPLEADGSIALELWPNTAGLRGTSYLVELISERGYSVETYGRIQIGEAGPYSLADLLRVDAPPAGNTFWSSISEADYNAKIAEMDAKASAASDSAELSQAWAEGTEPGGTGTKSAQEHAADAGDQATAAGVSAAQAALYDGVWLDDVATVIADETLSYGPGASGVSEGDYVRTRAEGFSYEVAASTATDHHLTTAGGVKLEVLPGADGSYPAAAFKSGTDTAALSAAITKAGDGGFVSVAPDMTPDYSAVSNNAFPKVTIFAEDGSIIVGGVGIDRPTEQSDHVVFRSRRAASGTTRVYVQPPETTLGQTIVQDGVVTSFTAFFDAYDAQGLEADTNPDWTGPHYRDGGVSCFVDNTSPLGDALVPEYSPAGLVAFNAKVGGNWWPFRPSAGLSVSEKPMVTVFELPTSVANAGPTFAGGGVYPTNRWRPGKAYSVGDICHEYGRVYEIVTAGTSGQTPPLHDGVGGARADAWDASILTTIGTLLGGFYRGTDGGGVVEYALLEQLYPMNADNTLLLGPALTENPMLGLGDNTVQIAAPTYLKTDFQIVAAKQEADGSGTTNNAGLHADTNGAMRYGYSDAAGLLARHNSSDNLHFDGVSASYSEVVKPDGDTTVDVSGVNIVKFNDSSAVNFTGFTGATQGQVIHLLFNNSNTTLVHSVGSLRIPGGANRSTDLNDGITVVMRSNTSAQVTA